MERTVNRVKLVLAAKNVGGWIGSWLASHWVRFGLGNLAVGLHVSSCDRPLCRQLCSQTCWLFNWTSWNRRIIKNYQKWNQNWNELGLFCGRFAYSLMRPAALPWLLRAEVKIVRRCSGFFESSWTVLCIFIKFSPGFDNTGYWNNFLLKFRVPRRKHAVFVWLCEFRQKKSN